MERMQERSTRQGSDSGSGQLEHVGILVAKILGRAPKPLGLEGGFFVVQYDSVVLSDFLDYSIERLVECLRGFLSDSLGGSFDAEGWASGQVDLVTHRVARLTVEQQTPTWPTWVMLENCWHCEASVRVFTGPTRQARA